MKSHYFSRLPCQRWIQRMSTKQMIQLYVLFNAIIIHFNSFDSYFYFVVGIFFSFFLSFSLFSLSFFYFVVSLVLMLLVHFAPFAFLICFVGLFLCFCIVFFFLYLYFVSNTQKQMNKNFRIYDFRKQKWTNKRTNQSNTTNRWRMSLLICYTTNETK